jgi:hypothetical protein
MWDGVEGVPPGPIAWARMFEKLLEARAATVSPVPGGTEGKNGNSLTVSELPKEAGGFDGARRSPPKRGDKHRARRG